MLTIQSIVLASTVAVSFLTGCASSSKPTSAAAPAPQAVACEKCKVTWVQVPIESKNRVVGYQSRQTMICPDCRNAVENFFATGKLQHDCKSCGPGALQTCEMH